MKREKNIRKLTLQELFPPSEPCSCEICLAYCIRPGWWTRSEAQEAIKRGYAGRMMLELSPERTFGVLSPAFKGNEVNYALQINSKAGCTFLKDRKCELHGTGLQPLECRYCHHDRKGLGIKCHLAIEKDWNTPAGAELIEEWMNITKFRLKRLIRKDF